MNRPHKFVPPLTEAQKKDLSHLWRTGSTARVRMRVHSLLVSAKGWPIERISQFYQVSAKGWHIERISQFYQVHAQTVSAWIDRWVLHGVNGLADRQRSGKPRGLSVEERKSVLDLLLIFPQAPRRVLAEFTQRTGKTISRSTLKRLAKEAGLSWKRVRKTTAKPPDKQAVEAARAVLTDFKKTSDRADGLILL